MPVDVQQRADAELGAAWRRCEAALPEGWVLQLGQWRAEPKRRLPNYEVVAGPYVWDEEQRVGKIIIRDDTPAAALDALTEALQARTT